MGLGLGRRCARKGHVLEDVHLRVEARPSSHARPHAAVPRHGDLNAPGSIGQLRSADKELDRFQRALQSPDTARAPRAVAPTAQLAFERFAEAHDVSQERLDVC